VVNGATAERSALVFLSLYSDVLVNGVMLHDRTETNPTSSFRGQLYASTEPRSLAPDTKQYGIVPRLTERVFETSTKERVSAYLYFASLYFVMVGVL
jgi:hypothetical protein